MDGRDRQLLEARFWEPQHGLYKDEADGQWNFTGYRGQNANMHMCEAMLAAFEASGEQRYVERALQLADNMTRRQAAKAGGLVWEHYDSNWEIDWDYNRMTPSTCSARGASSRATRPNGPSCC